MQKISLLKECIARLIKESLSNPVFEPLDPVEFVHDSSIGGDSIRRAFGIKMTPESANVFQLDQSEREDTEKHDGVFFTEWEIEIEVGDVYHSKGSPARLSGHPDTWAPADPEDFAVESYTVVGVYAPGGFVKFSDRDGQRLAAFLGNLTDDEVEQIKDSYLSNLPDKDDFYDWDDR